MAQLKDTTVNGLLTVTDERIIAGDSTIIPSILNNSLS